jgi:SAM-dependent methyltransferase
MAQIDASKEAFVRTWGAAGYRENFDVFTPQSGLTEDQIVRACLKPCYNPRGVALEIGCGAGFWVDRHLSPNFARVIALDVIPAPRFKYPNVRYVEVPDRDFTCHGVADGEVDFAWSFGCFCHLTPAAQAAYVRGVYRSLRSGGRCALYFANEDRRPGRGSQGDSDGTSILWCPSPLTEIIARVQAAGFLDVCDLMPQLPDAMIGARKP